MNLPTLPADKANHALYGGLIFAAASAISTWLGYAPDSARLIAASQVLGIAVIKEASDWERNRQMVARGLAAPHEVSVYDVLATLGGGLVCWASAVATGG